MDSIASRKLSVALAAVLLGLQFGSPSVAAVAAEDLELIESYVLSGEVEMLMAFLMDDQRARAQAAVDRGLAHLVEPHEMLTLRRCIADVLDGGGEELRGRLDDLDLPEPGQAEAARLIMELTECRSPLGSTSCPASPATRPATSTTSSVPMIRARAR